MNDNRKANVKIYKTFEDDFTESKNQSAGLPENFVWVHENIFYRMASAVTFALAWVFGIVYSKLVLRVKVKNRKVLKKYRKEGYFLYCNHTQAMGDAFIPTCVLGFKRFHTVAGAANLGIPVIGRLLPMIAAIITPDSIHDSVKFCEAVKTRIDEGRCVIIYPEAHVWEWYTKIRPFPATAFYFPVKYNAPSFSMTLVYSKKKRARESSKPRITVYIDGPFFPDEGLSVRRRREKLHDEIYEAMVKRSSLSDCEYIHYRKEGEAL
ncbi:MAG: 1-acyl-sn-glycerol-3-phosphate acyltransferase [Firmicutes bacterium]|nr:1-acyl-sn-glycerol-3-phosphate acyltransferase [Bacillota bacterium]MCD7788377.1 1-acyl-sn-glycerol-3-phosphate acyltransferase [Bacillota bacterium]